LTETTERWFLFIYWDYNKDKKEGIVMMPSFFYETKS